MKTKAMALGTKLYSRLHSELCVDPCPAQKYMDVKCKVAIITGGTSGIGLGIADQLLACGLHKAVICGRTAGLGHAAAQYLTDRHGQGRAEYMQLCVMNHKQFEDVYKNTLHKEGNVDILVNNAEMLSNTKWEQLIDVNVNGVIKGIQIANKYMSSQKNKGGCIVNVSSVVGFDSLPCAPFYVASKHAVIGLTKSYGARNQLSKSGARQIAICPGVTAATLCEQVKHSHDKVVSSHDAGAVGKGTVYAIQYGPPGSLWTIENSILARVNPPEHKLYAKKIMEL